MGGLHLHCVTASDTLDKSNIHPRRDEHKAGTSCPPRAANVLPPVAKDRAREILAMSDLPPGHSELA